MRVKDPLMSGGARGAFGPAVVFGYYRGSCLARRWLKTPNPDTVKQRTARLYLNKASKLWKSLTHDQQVAWDTYANQRPRKDVWNNTYYMSGYDAYVWNGCLLQPINDSISPTPPAGPPLGLVTGIWAYQILPGMWYISYDSGLPGTWVEHNMTDELPEGTAVGRDSYVFKDTELMGDYWIYSDPHVGFFYEYRIRQFYAEGESSPWAYYKLEHWGA